jgi:UDP-GlcNAc3NAcA epimerase
MKILTVVGARPQFVKAAPVSRVLREGHTEVLVHTGQHYDDAMSASFFRDLQMREPDVDLEVGSGSHASTTGEMLRRLEPIMLDEEPNGILLYGDTNSTLAGAVVAAKIVFANGGRPWLVHVEAGLRSRNPVMPEERNRIVADHLADLLLAPTAEAMANLEREGLAGRAELVGDVMVDAHAWAADRIEGRLPAVARDQPPYVLLTLHRAENVDDPAQLRAWLEAFRIEAPVIFPIHPRTSAAISRAGVALAPNIVPIDPVGHVEMVALEQCAMVIATDSGGVQREAYLAGVPCLTLRAETEWTETVDAGWNRLVSASPEAVIDALGDASFIERDRPRPPIFGDRHAAGRIVAALERIDAGWDRAAAAPREATLL